MCGIAGVVGQHDDARARMRHMVDTLKHRGPDDEGIYDTAGATLGQRRRSIIDLAGGHQPIVDATSGLSITFNSVIYNYKQLRDKLLREGIQLTTDMDTEVILRLYQLRGREAPEPLRGMFAFSISAR